MKLAALVAWTGGCALLLAVNLLTHGPAELSHLAIHIRDVSVLYGIGLAAGAGALWVGFLRRPQPVERLLGHHRRSGAWTLRVAGMFLTKERIHGPLGRSIAWDAIESIGTFRVNLVLFLEVLGAKHGPHRDGFRIPLWQNGGQIARLIRYYVDNPDERDSIGTLEGAETAVRLGLLHATAPRSSRDGTRPDRRG